MHPLTHMKLLVNLAQVDGKVAEREKNYIFNIGRAHNIPVSEIQTLFEKEHAVIVPEGLLAEEKFNCIYSLVQLMKIDERMYQEEIRFCSAIATRLGYDEEALFELMLNVHHTDIGSEEQIIRLREVVNKHLKG